MLKNLKKQYISKNATLWSYNSSKNKQNVVTLPIKSFLECKKTFKRYHKNSPFPANQGCPNKGPSRGRHLVIKILGLCQKVTYSICNFCPYNCMLFFKWNDCCSLYLHWIYDWWRRRLFGWFGKSRNNRVRRTSLSDWINIRTGYESYHNGTLIAQRIEGYRLFHLKFNRASSQSRRSRANENTPIPLEDVQLTINFNLAKNTSVVTFLRPVLLEEV